MAMANGTPPPEKKTKQKLVTNIYYINHELLTYNLFICENKYVKVSVKAGEKWILIKDTTASVSY